MMGMFNDLLERRGHNAGDMIRDISRRDRRLRTEPSRLQLPVEVTDQEVGAALSVKMVEQFPAQPAGALGDTQLDVVPVGSCTWRACTRRGRNG